MSEDTYALRARWQPSAASRDLEQTISGDAGFVTERASIFLADPLVQSVHVEQAK